MGIREDMMEKMMGNMPKEEKQKMMQEAMTKMMAEMTVDEKQRIIKEMMGQFFTGMSEDDKGDMMKSFMPEMMKNMMGGGMMSMMSQMAGEKREEGMMKMMRKCMSGDFEPPWVTMQSIMEQVLEICGFALVHTPELHSLFSEFIHKRQEEVLSQISGRLTLDNLKEKTGFKNESLIYIILQLALLDEVELIVERKRKPSRNP